MVWPVLQGAQPMNLITAKGNDVQVHVDWQSSYGRFKFWEWDTTSGQQETDYYSLGSYSASYADFVVERVQFQQPDGSYAISLLRNFWTGLTVNAAQANNTGMQNYPLMNLNMYTKAGTWIPTRTGP